MTTYTHSVSSSSTLSLDRVVGDIMGAAFGASSTARSFQPALDVRSSGTEVSFVADVPGVREEDLEVTLENHVLTISGARKPGSADELPHGTAVVLGRAYGSFKRAFSLPENLDEEKLSAALSDGVLTVRIPKRPKVQPRRIAIQGAALKAQPVSPSAPAAAAE